VPINLARGYGIEGSNFAFALLSLHQPEEEEEEDSKLK